MILDAFSLSGRVAIVTGGNGGLGLAMAGALGSAGAKVAIVGRDEAKGATAIRSLQEQGIDAIFVAADISSQAGAKAMRDGVRNAYDRIDILVNNAGINIRKLPQEYTVEEWHTIQRSNVDSAYFCSVAVHPDMVEAGGGKIINVGSMMSIFAAAWNVPYSASKGAVVQLTRGLAAAWAKDNIQCNVILPGWFNTEMTASSRKRLPELEKSVEARTPAGRWGEPSEMGGVIVFLASAATTFVTGVSVPVDGGFSIQG
jgi:2-deoxy-D-gluconate 3-dehydrogenase